jgi:MOSC domain-containing protein YiiM
MRILAISVGKPKTIKHMGKDVPTAIYKYPVVGPCMVRKTNIDGDQQANLKAHGGPDKTVLAFPFEHYSSYQKLYGQETYGFGHFGENLTTEGLTENNVRIGDRFSVGQAVFEVTMPRFPCFKFGIKLGTSKALGTCISTGKTGFYLHVLDEGMITAGDVVKYLESNETAPSVEAVHRLRFFGQQDIDGMRQVLECAALSQVLKNLFSERVAAIENN